MPILKKLILIDDDPLCIKIIQVISKSIMPDLDIHIFTEPRQGLDHLLNITTEDDARHVVLLDLNMPQLSGWDILKALESRKEIIMQNCSLYIISTSLESNDRSLAAGNPMVSGFFEKPITRLNLQHILQ